MDHGGMIGEVEQLQRAWSLIQDRGPEMGLELNPSKCEWSWLDPSCAKPCPIRLAGVDEKDQVKLVPHDKIEMLGVPLGDRASTPNMSRDLLTRLKPVLERLEAFEDTQAAFYLLRVSFSIVRATHYMRTTPLDQWREHAEAFDANLITSAENILGAKMAEPEPDPQAGRVGPSPHSRPRDTRVLCELDRSEEHFEGGLVDSAGRVARQSPPSVGSLVRVRRTSA